MFGIEAYANQDLVYLMFGVFILIAIFLWSYHWKAAKMAQFAHIKSMAKIADHISKPKKITKRVLSCLVYLLLIFTILRPQGIADHNLDDADKDTAKKEISSSLSMEDLSKKGAKSQKVKVRESARDIIFLLDVSASMGAEDLYPNRLSKAKQIIHDVVSALDGEHIGLVIFTSVPSVKCVLTLDYTYFLDILDKVTINDNDFAGTKFTPALSEIINKQFDFSENENKDLFIITDGGDTDVEGLEGQDRTAKENSIYDLSAQGFETKGIRIHTIGLGSREGSVVQGVKNQNGQVVKSSLNEDFLKNISAKAKGLNISVADGVVDMKNIYLTKIATEANKEKLKEIELDKNRLKELVEKQKEKGEQKIVYKELYTYPLLLALILLITEFFVSEKKRKTKSSDIKIVSLILLFSLLPTAQSHAAQDEVTDLTTRGNTSYDRKEFDKAANLYDKALKIEAKNPIILYNLANVLFQQGKYGEAFAKYQEAIKASPPRQLISNIYFNAGNTALELAKLQTKEKEGIEELQKSISHYETSFTMYRKSLAQARAVSIAEGRNVKDAGLSAKKNWALARESWTAALDKIKTLQKKNMTLEDGIKSLLTAQSSLLPSLESIFLNSLTEDTLKFNLKKLAEYQLDYKEEIGTLRDLANKQEEETRTKIANLQTTTPPITPGATTPPSQDTESPESAELEEQLKTAQEIKKAVQQAAALDEWIVDNLKKNQAMEAWGNAHKMVGLLEDLNSFLGGGDPALRSYQGAISQLEAAERLVTQAKSLKKIDDNENAALASRRRTTLAGAKTSLAAALLSKINFYLEKIKEQQEKETSKAENDPADTTSSATKEEAEKTAPKEAAQQALRSAIEGLASDVLTELHTRNKQLSQKLQELSRALEDNKEISITEPLKKYRAALVWYQHLDKSIDQLSAGLIKDSDIAEDIINTLLETTPPKDQEETTIQDNPQLTSLPNEEQMNILLFQLEEIIASLKSAKKADDTNSSLQELSQSIEKQRKNLHTSWQQEKKVRENPQTKYTDKALLEGLSDLRVSLIRNLLIFSPDMAISLYFERSAELQQHLLDLLPIQTEAIPTIKKRYTRAASEAAGLNSLLVSFLDNMQKSIASIDGKEKQETYQESLNKRQKSVSFIQRLIDAGHTATSLLGRQKFQGAELLLKDMPSSLKKSRMAFSEQPKEAEKALSLAIELQTRLEEQCRAASAAVTVESEPEKLAPYVAANQEDINTLSDSAIILLQNMIGMADVPTQGQDPNAHSDDPNKVDSKKLNEAINKVGEAQRTMTKNSAFLKAGEFHNTFSKHQEIIDLLQEALDLLKNKDQKKEDKKDEKKDANKKDDQQKDKKDQDKKQNEPRENGSDQGKSQPKKPLELSPQEARELLKQLNKQDEKQQHQAIPSTGQKQINTPGPW